MPKHRCDRCREDLTDFTARVRCLECAGKFHAECLDSETAACPRCGETSILRSDVEDQPIELASCAICSAAAEAATCTACGAPTRWESRADYRAWVEQSGLEPPSLAKPRIILLGASGLAIACWGLYRWLVQGTGIGSGTIGPLLGGLAVISASLVGWNRLRRDQVLRSDEI